MRKVADGSASAVVAQKTGGSCDAGLGHPCDSWQLCAQNGFAFSKDRLDTTATRSLLYA